MHDTPWVIVLAAGSGTRLSGLTVGADGVAVPKQFCSLRGGRSLLIDTLSRARQLAPRQRIVVVVAREHEQWWRRQLQWLDPDNVLVQPENRGTTAGVVLPLAHVLARDPGARVVFMPSDHHCDRPSVLVSALDQALRDLRAEPQRLVLLGMTPDAADPEYGWIVPGPGPGALRPVAEFEEKPAPRRAAGLLQQGALWNTFLFVGSGSAVWELCRRRAPTVTASIAAAVAAPPAERGVALATAYATLPPLDFSRVVLAESPEHLRVRLVPECGWTDLGTPNRVAECLDRIERRVPERLVRAPWFSTVDLAQALHRRRAVAAQMVCQNA